MQMQLEITGAETDPWQSAAPGSLHLLGRPGRILVACESSGAVRDAFNRLGHVATSCDMLESVETGRHHTGDVREILNQEWDLMVAHPPCTYLSSSGMHWTTRGLRDPQLTEDALDFVRMLMDSPIPHIAIENPVGAISTRIRKATQYIHPYQFGDDASKKTGLWLKNLEPLKPTRYVEPRIVNGKERRANQCDSGQNKLGPSDDRCRERSKTYQGIAEAMADQWGGDSGWREVSFAADCTDHDDEYDETGEPGNVCSVCGGEYDTCPCPGPTQDGWETKEWHGVLMARRTDQADRRGGMGEECN